MMRIVTAIFIAAAHATEISDELADKLLDKLVDKLFGTSLSARAVPMVSMPRVMDQPATASVWPLASSRPQTQTNALPALNYRQPAAVSPLTTQTRNLYPSVQEMQDTLQSHGFQPSAMQKLALTAIAGTRDVSMAAQARNMISTLDPKDKKIVTAAEEAVSNKYAEMAGVTAPMNFWDPWGIASGKVTDAEVLFYREVELKHGRVGMLAFLGIIFGEKVAPLFGAKPDIPAGMVMDQSPNNPAFWLIAFLVVSNWEFNTLMEFGSSTYFEKAMKANGWGMDNKGRVSGDFGFDPLGLKPKDPVKLVEMQNKELNNGRLAMIASAGIIAQEIATGKSVFR